MPGTPLLAHSKTLKLHNILSLISLRPFCYVELNLIALIQRFETSGLNSGMVNENIIPRSAPDKSVALLVIEPLYRTLFFHLSSFLILAPLLAGVLFEPHYSCTPVFVTIRLPWGALKQKWLPSPTQEFAAAFRTKYKNLIKVAPTIRSLNSKSNNFQIQWIR